MSKQWNPERDGLRYVLKKLEWADAFGSAYRFYRDNGKVLRFWTRKAAQEHADKLNEATP